MTTPSPQDQQALFTAATAAHQAGKLADAAGLYRRILAVSRRYPDVLHLLGLIEHQSGAQETAAALIREAIALEPKQPAYHNNLASVLIELGDIAGARAAAQRAIALHPAYPQAFATLGTALLRAGDLAAAATALRRAIDLAPDNAPAHYWLGRAQQDQGRFGDAAASYRTVIALAPTFADAHCNLGYVLFMAGQPHEGIRHCREAIALSPSYADAYNNLGYIHQSLGELENAKTHYEQAIAHHPRYAAAFNNLGNLYKDLGDVAAAAASYRKALAFEPDFARARYNLSDIARFRAGDEDMIEIAAQLARPDLPPAQACYLHFAMGKALEDTGDADGAFAHFHRGNSLKRSGLTYDEDFMLGYLRDMARLYNADTLKRLGGGGSPSTVPIFIVGMPRSGTTLVEQILASHGKVIGGGERTDFDAALAASLPPGEAPVRAAALTTGHLRNLGEAYLARLPQLPPGAAHLTDKMPANFMHVGLIHLALPNAKIIHVVRDPADTCVSCYLKLFETGQEFTYDLGELGRYYLGYRRLMDHWRNVMPAAIHEISYERLVAEPEREIRRLLTFCGLDWEAGCLAFHTTQRPVQTASALQVRQPLYASSVGRSTRYERHIGPLLSELARL